MKVLHIISSSGMYGAEAVILNLSRVLKERGHKSLLAAFSNASNPNLQLYEKARAEGIESYVIPCSGQVDRSAIIAIRQLALRTGAEIAHSHNFKSDVYLYLALRRTHIPYVATCHTWYDTDFLVTMYGRIDRLVLRCFPRVVAVSREVRQRLLNAGVHAQRIRDVRNGIDLRPFANAQPSLTDLKSGGALLVGLIGRLTWEKGVDVFVDAAACVLHEFSEARFVIVGEGPYRERLERSIQRKNLGEHVLLLGRREDMPGVYASLDIMASASRQEGLPMAILEGMATGRPLVATTVGEVPTIVVNGRTGILVPPENPDKLAAGILELLRDPAKRSAMGAAGRQLIRDEYSAERMTADYLQVYSEVIAADSRRHRGGER